MNLREKYIKILFSLPQMFNSTLYFKNQKGYKTSTSTIFNLKKIAHCFENRNHLSLKVSAENGKPFTGSELMSCFGLHWDRSGKEADALSAASPHLNFRGTVPNMTSHRWFHPTDQFVWHISSSLLIDAFSDIGTMEWRVNNFPIM